MKDKNTNTEKTTFEKIKFSEPVTIIFGSILAILFVMGETKAILPMAIGTIFGTVVSVYTVGALFDSPLFPAKEAWDSIQSR
ncbi:hypothetical protein ACTNB0_07040 [Lachnospiraceae bacterium HCP28S3_F9]